MDHGKFIDVIKQFSQVWDRNCATFREQNLKADAWERVGSIMGYSAAVCKDTFKSLREKYVREREKQTMFGAKYSSWQHMESLSFLDPHIILRKQSLSNNCSQDQKSHEPHDVCSNLSENYSDFDKTLITLVKKSSPIWDRKSNGYPSKQVKFQLWKEISQTMGKDINVCMMRWKGLREKYIRQKNKYQEGDSKWEFLDDMSFLDQVIHYRRKHCPVNNTSYQSTESNFHMTDDFEESSPSFHDSSSNDCSAIVKNEDFGSDIQESSYDSGTGNSLRKRSCSEHSEERSYEKRGRVESLPEKTPEIMFGQLVAAMLAKKNERDKNIAMIEVMKVLTK